MLPSSSESELEDVDADELLLVDVDVLLLEDVEVLLLEDVEVLVLAEPDVDPLALALALPSENVSATPEAVRSANRVLVLTENATPFAAPKFV
ncbi:MAG: hypothetical protein Phyf2KO_11120 [Phycisphaerales bacterium]